MAAIHVVGAGLAGLAAAVRLAGQGRPVMLYEAAQQAGGRCRSYFDRGLDRIIDNGNHLLLSGNRATLDYLDAIGARDELTGPPEPCFPFLDLASGKRWTVRPNRGLVPVWPALPGRRVPGTRFRDYLGAWRLACARPEQTVADCLDPNTPLWRRFWEPLARAVLNTPPEQGSARLLWAALRESFARGGAGCRPLIARTSLAATLIDPALRRLAEAGVTVAFGQILALPPGQTGALLPEIRVPESSHAIVNGHFRLERPARLPDGSPLLGLIGGTAEWLFVRDELVSLTVSAADALADQPSEAIAERFWADTARALDLPATPQPPVRIVKERRATFAQTPAAAILRPGAGTPWSNLHLAGDWTATGLPATIEGAVRSGQQAAARAASALASTGRAGSAWPQAS